MKVFTLLFLCLLPSVIYGDILGHLGNFQFQKSLQFYPEDVKELSQKEVNFQKFYKNFKFRWEKEPDVKIPEESVQQSSEEKLNQYNLQKQLNQQQDNSGQESLSQNYPSLQQQNRDNQEYYFPQEKLQQNNGQHNSQQQQDYQNNNEQQQEQSQEEQQNDQRLQYHHKQKRNHQQNNFNEGQQQQSNEEQQNNQKRQQNKWQFYQQEQNLLEQPEQQQLYQQPMYPANAGYEQKYVQQYYESPVAEEQLFPQVSIQKYFQHHLQRNNAAPTVMIPNYVPRQNQFEYNGNMWVFVNPLQQSANIQPASIFNDAYQSMQQVSEEEKVQFHDAVIAAMENDKEVQLNITQKLQKQGHPVEEYTVKTDDGYYLTVFRIPPQQQYSEKNEVVFLMHGLFGSSDDWLTSGPGESLAYLLADAGYDVYLGNARGTKYSRKHASKHPAQEDFWQFSMDEIALQDLPAMINFTLQTSGRQQMYYAGHSLGATAMLALAASQPQYNDKIKAMFALAPIVFSAHNKSPFFKMIAEQDLSPQLGEGQFRPEQRFLQYAGGQICKSVTGCGKLCSNPAFVITGVNLKQLSPERIPTILANADTTSIRVLKQIGQWMASGDFRRYDYGSKVNKEIYGQRAPQSYQLEEVSMPVKMFFSDGDWLAQPEDVQTLTARLPGVDVHLVPEQLAHTDFVYSKNASKYIYQALMKIMEKN